MCSYVAVQRVESSGSLEQWANETSKWMQSHRVTLPGALRHMVDTLPNLSESDADDSGVCVLSRECVCM